MLIIDCHAHITSPDEVRYPPRQNPLRVPDGRGAIEDLRQTSAAHGVAAVRAVHTVSFYDHDNRYLADTAQAHPEWVAGVCALDPDDPGSPARLRELVTVFGVRTLRSVPGDGRRTFDHEGVRRLWRVCAEAGASVDLFLMSLEWVEGAEKLLRDFPDLVVGFDHCMDLKPGPSCPQVLAEVLRLAQYPNLIAKVDFVSTGTQTGFPGADLHGEVMAIIEAYGPERCVWGSNFPNALWTPRMTYGEHLRLFTEVLPLGDQTRTQILGENARRLWFPGLRAGPA